MAAPLRVCVVCCRYLEQFLKRKLHTSRRLTSNNEVRVRFAPSPTGFLHLGGLRTALYNYLFAKSKGGKFILRIEDTDQNRVVPGAVEKLESMLRWTGVIPDEGPTQGGDRGPYVQSERLELYQQCANNLVQNGSAYHCFCTPTRLDILRRDAIQRGETPRYDNRCRHLEPEDVKVKLADNVPNVVRLKLEPTTEPWDDMIKGPIFHNIADIEGDPVLLKTDGFPTYHLANVVDDHFMGVSHVLRGDEWQPSTPKHLLLYKAFGWQAPHFAHLPLIVNKDGTKLSKRQGDINIEHFKEQGYFPEAVLSYVTTIGGGFRCETSDMTLEKLVQQFQIERVKRHHGRLDPLFLEESNHRHLRRLLESEQKMSVVLALQNLLKESYKDRMTEGDGKNTIQDQDYVLHVLQWATTEDRVTKLSDMLEFRFLWEMPDAQLIGQLSDLHPDLLTLLTSCLSTLSDQTDFSKESLGKILKSQATSCGRSVREFMPLMRLLLSGSKEGPPVAEMISVMGKNNTCLRLKHCVQLVPSAS